MFRSSALMTSRVPHFKPWFDYCEATTPQDGEIAAESLLRRISQPGSDCCPKRITVEPELIIRESTGLALVCSRDPQRT